jgi:predicted ATP-grasp superfamily ATP-dependent carboligase
MPKQKSDPQKPYAVVVGLDCIQGLQSARILADSNVPVIGIAKAPQYYSTKTRVCKKIYFTDTGSEKLVEFLEELGPTLNSKAVLFPCQDKNVLVISEFRTRLEPWYHVMLPEHGIVEMLMNKASFYSYAQKKGFPIPQTVFLHSLEDAECAASQLTFPVIIKPPYRLRTWAKHTKLKGMVAKTPPELIGHYNKMQDWAESLIAQELIPGGDSNHYTCNCYYDRKGEPVVTFTSRKLRQWPPKTGQACLSEETRNDVVLDETIRVFSSTAYRGLGYIEMKQHDRTGEYFIIEPNIGRPTGRAATAEAANVQLLYTMYCDAVGLPLPDHRTQQYLGVKWVHLLRDLQAALYQWCHGSLTLNEWYQSIKGVKAFAVFSWRDPGPFFAALWKSISIVFSSRVSVDNYDGDDNRSKLTLNLNKFMIRNKR